MSKGIFGWELPPGVSTSDIPGNRPEDAEWEKISMDFWEKKPLVCSDELWNKFVEVKLENDLMEIVDDAIQYGIDVGWKQSKRDKEGRIAELENEIKYLHQRDKNDR